MKDVHLTDLFAVFKEPESYISVNGEMAWKWENFRKYQVNIWIGCIRGWWYFDE